jgi:hypothetical protein
MAPHGRLAGVAGAAAGVAGLAAAAWLGAAGFAASRCVTLLDCWPVDLPPPMRRAASAFKVLRAKSMVKIKPKILFTINSEKFRKERSTFNADVQGYHPCTQVVKFSMPKSGNFHKGFQLFLPRVHAN